MTGGITKRTMFMMSYKATSPIKWLEKCSEYSLHKAFCLCKPKKFLCVNYFMKKMKRQRKMKNQKQMSNWTCFHIRKVQKSAYDIKSERAIGLERLEICEFGFLLFKSWRLKIVNSSVHENKSKQYWLWQSRLDVGACWQSMWSAW